MLRVLPVNVGDTVRLNLPGPAGAERFRIMAILGATPMVRGPLLLRLKAAPSTIFRVH
jgi:hypothetical protein